MEDWGIDRTEFKRVVPLRKDELIEVKQFFQDDTKLENIELYAKIASHIFSKELNF